MKDDIPTILGGTPVRPAGPPSWPLHDQAVLEAMQRAYHDGSWGVYWGPHTKALEARLQELTGVEHILLCGSGTFAVELALRALGVEAGDEVIQSAYDFPGNFLDIHALGAMPVLVDVEPRNWNLSSEAVREGFSPRVKGLLVSHLHGGVAPMPELCELARERGLFVIEDAAQCQGGVIFGKQAGTWGDAGVFSFGGSKLLSAGRGGALITHRADVATKARNLLLRGNVICPLSELQAAVLLPQVDRLLERNQQRATFVGDLVPSLPEGLKAFENGPGEHNPGYYKLGMQYDAEKLGISRAKWLEAMRAEGIAMDAGYAALHVGRSPRRYRQGSSLAEAERAHHGCVKLHHPVLLAGAAERTEILAAMQKILTHARMF